MNTVGEYKNHILLNLDRLKALTAYGALTMHELKSLDAEISKLYEKHTEEQAYSPKREV